MLPNTPNQDNLLKAYADHASIWPIFQKRLHDSMSESIHARKGIKTLPFTALFSSSINWSESIHARKGIKTVLIPGPSPSSGEGSKPVNP